MGITISTQKIEKETKQHLVDIVHSHYKRYERFGSFIKSADIRITDEKKYYSVHLHVTTVQRRENLSDEGKNVEVLLGHVFQSLFNRLSVDHKRYIENK